MKFANRQSTDPSTPALNAEDIAKANRWEEREAKRKASHHRPIPPYERERVVRLYAQLLSCMGAPVADPWRVKKFSSARGSDARQAPQYREAAEEHLGELLDRYAEAPVALSSNLIAQNNRRMLEVVPNE